MYMYICILRADGGVWVGEVGHGEREAAHLLVELGDLRDKRISFV